MMKISYISIITILLVLLVAMSGCTSTGTPTPAVTPTPVPSQAANVSSYPMTVTDFYGMAVTFDKAPERIVSLSAANTEMIFALGAQSKIVGTDDYSDYPAEAKNITHVSGYNNINYERLMSISPDVILAEDTITEDAVTSLRDKGYKVVMIKNNNMTMIKNNVRLISQLTGTQDNATAVVNSIDARLDNISSKTAQLNDSQKPTVLLLAGYLSGESIYVYGNNTYGHDMILLDGGINAGGNISEYKPMSIEAILKADPDYIVIPVDGVMTTAKDFNNFKYGNESWMQGLKAVKNGHVIEVDGNLMMHPGPRMPDAALVMAKAIHPELFQ